MLPKLLLIIAGALLISGSASATEEAPRLLPKVGKWVINSNGRTCDLSGTFGEQSSPVILTFTRHVPSEYFVLTLLAEELEKAKNLARLSVSIGGKSTPKREDWEVLAMPDQTLALKMPGLRLERQLSGIVLAPSEKPSIADSVTIMIDGQTLQLQSGSLEAPIRALSQCTDELLRGWGYDPAQQAALARLPQPTNYQGDWVKRDDYPDSARRAGMRGTVWFRLDIDGDGQIRDCQIQESTAPPELQSTTCDLMRKRARFAPAVDREGNHVRSYFTNKIRWAP